MKKLYNNKNLVNMFCNILSYTNTFARFELVNKLLSDKKLYNNENLVKNFCNILHNTNICEGAQIKINLLYKFKKLS